MRTRVQTVTCSSCGAEMYSRAVHDFHGCKCGTFVDGGFDYLRCLYNGVAPKVRVRYVNASRRELYDDWNMRINKYGFIKETKCSSMKSS